MWPLLLVPACFLALPPAGRPAELLLEALEGVPECVVEGHAARLPQESRKAVKAWRTHRAAMTKRLSAEDLAKIEASLVKVQEAGADAAEAALDAQGILAGQVAEGRPRQLMAADRACMRAWLRAGAGRWEALPDLDGVFAPLLAPGQARYAATQAKVRVALDRQRGAAAAKDGVGFKAAIRDLLNLVDALEE